MKISQQFKLQKDEKSDDDRIGDLEDNVEKLKLEIEFKNEIQKAITICHALDLEGEGSLRKFVVDVTKRQFANIKKRYNSDNIMNKGSTMTRG